MPEIALVTGAYGFVGRHLARQLADAGSVVIGIGHGAWPRSEWSQWGLAEWHTADLTLEALITFGNEPNFIFHCAGSGSVAYSTAHPYQDFQRTVATTMAALEYARLYAQQAKFVLPSSAAIYGNTHKFPTLETEMPAPVSPYGIHKAICEELCHGYATHFGLSIALVRLFSVYGAGLRKQLLWDACSKLQRLDSTFHGTGEEARDWIHVDDAVRLLRVASRYASPTCPVANGGSGRPVAVRDVLNLIVKQLGSSQRPDFSCHTRTGDPVVQAADITVASDWEWQPMVDLETGIRQYVEWFKSGAT